ncbi:hypothetical protein BMF94_1572 [Rhodotorula taiwanensis]|uniref:BZIP domain-containing protein n=1 Tax=Rhodotorula taiwanensis TaxID=741276 RepID=A0A2S5BF00_9BASI|nr:hypothetical protein BMF94_1572 [Rhodotorula taiwanensis]
MYADSGFPSPAPSSSSLMSGTSDSATSSSHTGRTKRHATEVDYAALEGQAGAEHGLTGGERPSKRRAPRSTAAEKQARKVARMERNRIAAQVSRDKKKQQQELLEARIHQLEDELAHRDGTPAPRAPIELAPVPVPPPTQDPHEVDQLKEENETLKTQLALEKLHSQSLQIRLAALETKFSRLEQLLDKSTLLAHRPSVAGGVATHPERQPETKTHQDTEEDQDSSRLVAREVDSSLQRKLSCPLPSTRALPSRLLSAPTSLPPVVPLDLDYGLALDNGAGAGGLELDLGGGVGGVGGFSTEPAPSAGLDSSPLFGVDDSATGFVAPLFSESDVNQAWLDWSLNVEPTSVPAPTLGAIEPPATDFDLVAFLRDQQQDALPVSFAASTLAC